MVKGTMFYVFPHRVFRPIGLAASSARGRISDTLMAALNFKPGQFSGL
jgi:hypothetical protein